MFTFSFFDPSSGHGSHFGIVHYTGKVAYDASLMIQQNRDHIPDDVVWVFAKQNCNFGFASHLFSSEIKVTHGELIYTWIDLYSETSNMWTPWEFEPGQKCTH